MKNLDQSSLYQLSLNTNNSHFLEENCSNFISLLLEISAFNRCWLFINGKTEIHLEYGTAFPSEKAFEQFRTDLYRKHITPFSIIEAQSINSEELKEGLLLIFKMNTVGYFCLHTKLSSKELTEEAVKLLPIIEQFAQGILSCQVHSQMLCAKNHLRRIFNIPPIPMVIYDPITLQILACNDRAIKFYGYKEYTLIEKSLFILFEEDELEILKLKHEKKEKLFCGENSWKHQKKDGTIVHVCLSQNDVVYENTPAKIMAVKDLIFSNKAIRIQEPGLFPDENPSPVLRFSTKTNHFEYCNKAGEKIIQFLEAIDNKDIYSHFLSKLYESKHNNEHIQYEIKVENRVFLCQIVPISAHNYINLYLTDISDMKNLLQALKYREEKYKRVLENLELGLLEVDIHDRIVRAYPKFCQMTGYTEDELIGQNTKQKLLPSGQFNVRMDKALTLRNAGETGVNEVQIKRKDGSIIWVLINGAPLYDKDNKIIGSTGIHLDITERKKLETEILKAKETAEESVKAKEIFMANMSHEIRTPMNAIIGFGELLMDTPLSEYQIKYLKSINGSADNLLTIINDILDFSKINAGKLALENIDFDLKSNLQDSIFSLSKKAKEKGIFMELDYDNTISSSVKGDPNRLSQILLNLLNNAVKFTNSGGIQLSVKLIKSTQGTNTILFNVKDTGIGIQQNKLKSIFGSFTQEEKGTSRMYGGTGLGLAISKQIVQQMNGQLEVKSKKGLGSEFYFTLKFKKGKPISIQQTSDEEYNISLLNKKILLVEDNPVNQMMTSTMLKKWGYIVDIADDGWVAIEKLKSENFDLILMDMRMPHLNGVEATKIIRQELTLKVPILALTANAIKGDKEKCIEIGMNDYISKPFKGIELKRLVAKWLNEDLKMVIEKPVKNLVKLKPKSSCLYDFTELYELAKKDKEFINEMILLFVNETTKDLERMKQSIKSKDCHNLSDIAHKLKASLDHMANSEIRKEIREIEDWEDSDLKMIAKTKQFIKQLYLLIDQVKVLAS